MQVSDRAPIAISRDKNLLFIASSVKEHILCISTALFHFSWWWFSSFLFYLCSFLRSGLKATSMFKHESLCEKYFPLSKCSVLNNHYLE